MGSRYDVAVFFGVQLTDFQTAVADRYQLGDRVDGPWLERDSVAVAEFSVGDRHGVFIASSPMKTPRGIDARLAEKLGAGECAFATVWDSVGTYELTVVGDGIDRHLSIEAEDDSEPQRYASGTTLREEPAGDYLDESFVQQVFTRRYGFDQSDAGRLGWEWRALVAL